MVWGVAVPPKVRIFLWRGLNDIIPTPANLRAHHVPSDGICSLCKDRWGTTAHCLISCPVVHQIWKSSRFARLLRRARGLDLVTVADMIRNETCKDDYEVWVWILWQVWVYICKLNHPESNAVVEAPSEESCLSLREAYCAAGPAATTVNGLGVKVGDKAWRRPRRGRLRVDVDAHFAIESRNYGVGVLVRNHEGELMAAMMKLVAPSSSALRAEVAAIMHAIKFCMELNLGKGELFTDSFLAARILADPYEEQQLLSPEHCDLLRVARGGFLIDVKHMLRKANKVAHALASCAASSHQSAIWTDSFPSWLMVVVKEDLV